MTCAVTLLASVSDVRLPDSGPLTIVLPVSNAAELEYVSKMYALIVMAAVILILQVKLLIL